VRAVMKYTHCLGTCANTSVKVWRSCLVSSACLSSALFNCSAKLVCIANSACCSTSCTGSLEGNGDCAAVVDVDVVGCRVVMGAVTVTGPGSNELGVGVGVGGSMSQSVDRSNCCNDSISPDRTDESSGDGVSTNGSRSLAFAWDSADVGNLRTCARYCYNMRPHIVYHIHIG
jgi:hypothetical protein